MVVAPPLKEMTKNQPSMEYCCNQHLTVGGIVIKFICRWKNHIRTCAPFNYFVDNVGCFFLPLSENLCFKQAQPKMCHSPKVKDRVDIFFKTS